MSTYMNLFLMYWLSAMTMFIETPFPFQLPEHKTDLKMQIFIFFFLIKIQAHSVREAFLPKSSFITLYLHFRFLY